MKHIGFSLKTDLLFGPESLLALPSIVEKREYKRIALIIDAHVEKTSYWQRCKVLLDELVSYDPYFLNEKMEPTYAYLDAMRSKFSSDVDLMIGVGGGSTMDIAKAMSVLVTNHKPSMSYRGFDRIEKKGIPLILVPSTAGSGSEVTPYAVFIDENEQRKFGINSPLYLPIQIIIDPLLAMEAPLSVTISSGMDALIHTIESYISTRHTHISRLFSREAFRLLGTYLPRVLLCPDDIDIRTHISLGAYYAGIALFNSGAGIVGGLSYPLGTLFHVTHGMAGAVFLSPVVSLNIQKGYDGYGELFSLLDGDSSSDSFLQWMSDLSSSCKIPTSLSSFGMKEKDVPLFMKHMEHLWGLVEQNPVHISREDIKQLLTSMVH